MDHAAKILLFMKRRPGLSPEAFRDYYETRHAPLCATYSRGIGRYIRRFLDPLPDPATGRAAELPFDVITELWFDDAETARATAAYLATATMPDEVIADEEKLFDRAASRMALVIECETALAPRAG